jgi:hypothetical protein
MISFMKLIVRKYRCKDLCVKVFAGVFNKRKLKPLVLPNGKWLDKL